jgi:hypothetical protein
MESEPDDVEVPDDEDGPYDAVGEAPMSDHPDRPRMTEPLEFQHPTAVA